MEVIVLRKTIKVVYFLFILQPMLYSLQLKICTVIFPPKIPYSLTSGVTGDTEQIRPSVLSEFEGQIWRTEYCYLQFERYLPISGDTRDTRERKVAPKLQVTIFQLLEYFRLLLW